MPFTGEEIASRNHPNLLLRSINHLPHNCISLVNNISSFSISNSFTSSFHLLCVLPLPLLPSTLPRYTMLTRFSFHIFLHAQNILTFCSLLSLLNSTQLAATLHSRSKFLAITTSETKYTSQTLSQTPTNLLPIDTSHPQLFRKLTLQLTLFLTARMLMSNSHRNITHPCLRSTCTLNNSVSFFSTLMQSFSFS